MGWLQLVPLIITATIVLFGAGLLVTSATKFPILAKVASAPAAATAVIAMTAIVVDIIGARFSPTSAAVGFVVSAALAWVIRILMERYERSRRTDANLAASSPETAAEQLTPAPAWVTWLALGGAFLLMVRHWRNILDRPDAFSQTYDNIYHLNAVRWILETGSGSTLAFTMTAGDGPPKFYPSAWHDTVALVAMIARSADVAAAVNAVTLVLMGLVWTTGCLFLARSLTNGSTAAVLAAAVLSASFAGFPFLLLGFGVLYPYFFGLCMVPSLIALTIHILGIQTGPGLHLGSAICAGLLALGGISLGHPNATLAYVVVAMPMLGASVWNAISHAGEPGGALRLKVRAALFVAALVVVPVGWQLARPNPADSFWGPYLNMQEAVGSGILFAAGRLWPAWALALLAVVGAYAAFRWRRHRWLVVAHLFMIGLWAAASAMPFGTLRSYLVGVWYNDSYRLAALLPLTGLPLAVLGAEHLARLATGWLTPRLKSSHNAVQPGVAVLLAALVLASTQATVYMNAAIDQFSESFQLTPDSALVSTDEYEVIQVAATTVPDSATVATDPWNGSSMVFALAGRRSTTTHVTYDLTPALETINQRLDEVGSDPSVCPAVNELSVRYVLDFGPVEVHGGDHDYPGLDQLDGAPGFKLIVRKGDAALYEVTACS